MAVPVLRIILFFSEYFAVTRAFGVNTSASQKLVAVRMILISESGRSLMKIAA